MSLREVVNAIKNYHLGLFALWFVGPLQRLPAKNCMQKIKVLIQKTRPSKPFSKQTVR